MDYRIDHLKSQLREDPSSRLFYKLGELFRREGASQKAIEVLESGLVHHSRYVAAWVALGRAQLALDQFAEAETSFARALEIDPDNAVAARMIGESAAGRGDWVRAVKALKLARALSPGDEELEERIEEVEERLAEAGLLEVAREADDGPQSSAAEGAATDFPGAEPVEDPNAITLEDPLVVVRPAAGPKVVTVTVAAAGEDPFAITRGGDSGVWRLGDEVFTVSSDSVETLETVPGELPLPTLTLARLARDQGDPELAETTLRSLLARHPENTEAADLLRQVEQQIAGVEPVAAPTALVAAKIATLRGWMEAVRLAAERQGD